MPATHHKIEITIRGQNVVPATIPELRVGDTVRYFFKGDGKVIVTFPKASPYRPDKNVNTQVPGDEDLKVLQEGKFPSGCQIVPSKGKPIGWDPKNPEGTKGSGADHDVRR